MTVSPDVVRSIIGSLEGTEVARFVNVACLALAAYEWLLTLDQELEYFWTGQWTLSRILFFFNRYFPIFAVMFGFIVISFPNPTVEFCTTAIQFSLFVWNFALGVIQAMLILRVWYLFPYNKYIQCGLVILWIVSMSLSLTYTGMAATGLEILNGKDDDVFTLGAPGCRASRPVKFWRIFLPTLFLHTVLYILTAVRALRNHRILEQAPVLKRLLRDGGIFFFVVFVTVGFTTVGSFLENVPQINIPVIFSGYLVTITSIAMSRIMFSIHSLASNLGSDAGWLLSNVELRRVDWRRGATEGEILVECTNHGYENNHDDLESNDPGTTSRSQSALKMSKVGMFNDDTMWPQ